MIVQNIEQLRIRIEGACRKAGRKPEEVGFVAVSKTFGVDRIQEALDAGVYDFGENYVQELRKKAQALEGRGIRWHFVGHLQSNKVKYIADEVVLIHSLDSLSLAREIQKRSAGGMDVLVEVHTTDESTKTGVRPEDVVRFTKEVSVLDRVRVRGLMTMGPFSDNPNDSRTSFRTLAQLRRAVEQEGIEGVSMEHLSMGMTDDFEVAVEEGATLLRIGTAIFGRRSTAQENRIR